VENADIANEILVSSGGEDVALQVVDTAAEVLEQIQRDGNYRHAFSLEKSNRVQQE